MVKEIKTKGLGTMKIKRIISLLLATLTVFMLVPFSASADETTKTVDVSFVSSNGTAVSGEAENVFDANASTSYVAKNTTDGLIITGKLASPTVISRVVFKATKAYSNRTNKSFVYASADGFKWVQIGQNTKANTESDGTDSSNNYLFNIDITDTTVYRYIRFVQNVNYKNYEVGLAEIEVVGEEQSTTVGVSLLNSNGTYDTSKYGAPENVFDGDTSTSYISMNKDSGLMITGMLAASTVIDEIVLTVDTSKGNRTYTSYFEASEDGESWTKIATNNTKFDNNNGSYVFKLAVSDKNSYRYIRFVQNVNYKGYEVGIAEIEIKGREAGSPLDIAFVEANENQSENGGNPQAVFDKSGSTSYTAKNTAEGVRVTGKLNGKYRISSVAITVPSGDLVNRTFGSCIEGSVDGKDWKVIAQNGKKYADNGGSLVFVMNVTDTTPYRYIRFKQNEKYKNYEVGITEIEAIGTPVHTLTQTYVKSSPDIVSNSSKDLSNAFKDNLTQVNAQTTDKTPFYGIAKLEEPTQITRVTVRAPATSMARMRYMLVKASVDGEVWDIIATCPYVMAENEEKIFTVNSETYYNYIRYEQNAYCASQGWWFSVGSVLVDGIRLSEKNTAISRGVQVAKTGTDEFSLRFLATVGNIDGCNAVGMEINATVSDGTKKNFKVNTYKVYKSVIEVVDGVQTTVNAGEGVLAGGKYVYTVVVEGIPIGIGLVTFDVTPYMYVDGERINGDTVQYVFNGADSATSASYKLKENEEYLKVQGRSYELDDGIACDFTASGIEFNAVCGGDIELTANCTADTYYTVYINGIRQSERLAMSSGTATYTVAKKLAAGRYNIKLVKQSHVNHSISSLMSLTMYGNFTEAPRDSEYLIEFIGDSITCGYGTVNYPDTSATYFGTAYYCDATAAYAYKTADSLGADYSMISVSGWTLLSGDNSVPGIYGKTSWHRGDTLYTPERKADIVVINLGTNDKNQSNYTTDFVSQSVEFISEIRAMHGEDVTIIWAYGAMMTGDVLTTFTGMLDQIVEQTGILAVQLQYDNTAGNGHPSDAGHTASAEILTKYIRDNNLLK